MKLKYASTVFSPVAVVPEFRVFQALQGYQAGQPREPEFQDWASQEPVMMDRATRVLA